MKIADIITEETLEELVGIKNKIKDLPQNPRKVAEYPLGLDWHKVLYNNGFSALGSGSFGTVWANPKLSYVLKVFTSQDKAYIDWISTAIQHKSNPHMPRFVSPRSFEIVPGVMAVRTEKLGRITREAYELLKPINALIDNSIRTGFSPSKIVEELVRRRGDDAEPPKPQSFAAYCEANPEFIPALDIVSEFIKKTGYKPDIHDDNIMMRGDTIVFSDPVFDKKALSSR